MLGPKQEAQGALFYEFSIEDHVPQTTCCAPSSVSSTCPAFASIWPVLQ